MIVKTKIDMDLAQAGPVRSVHAVQGDTNTRMLELSMDSRSLATFLRSDFLLTSSRSTEEHGRSTQPRSARGRTG